MTLTHKGNLYSNCVFSFAVTDELIGRFLEGFTIKAAIRRKKLFIINHALLEGVPTYQNRNVRKTIIFCYLLQ